MIKQILLTLLFILSTLQIYTDDKPVIAVLDFKYSGISALEAAVLIDYLTASIVETDKFRVIQKAGRNAILLEQEFSLSYMTDERYHVKIGRLLSANQVVVGSIGIFRDKYLLTLKLIDIQSGETLKIETDKFDSTDELLEQGKYLAYKIAASEEQYLEITKIQEKEKKKFQEQKEKERREREREARRRNIERFFHSLFYKKNTTWNFDFSIGIATGRYSVPTGDSGIVEANSIVALFNLGLGYYISDYISTTFLLGFSYEEYLLYKRYASYSSGDRERLYNFLIGGRLYIGNLRIGPAGIIELGYLNTETTFRGFYYSFGLYFYSFFLTLSPLRNGIYGQLGYTFRITR